MKDAGNSPTPETVAIWRIFYGEDFIVESILSVLPFVDKAIVYWTDRPWGSWKTVTYKGKTYKRPGGGGTPMNGWHEKVGRLRNRSPGLGKVEREYFHVDDPMNQFTRIVNQSLIPQYGKPETLIVLEPDHVLHYGQLTTALREFKSNGYRAAHTKQIDLWKTTEWRIPERPNRTGTVFWNLSDLDEMPETKRQAEPRSSDFVQLNAYTHNLGFCVSQETMLLKHVCALGFSQEIGDSMPNEDWFERKWLHWNPTTNNRDLEIAKGYEHMIPKAVPYDPAGLPGVLREDLHVG